MTKEKLYNGINKVEEISSASKIKRMMNNPFRYLEAILFKSFIYPRKKIPKEVTSELFFDLKMNLLLPSSTDIYLTGGKSHESEIRLAKFLIRNLNAGDVFIDVGAHYGYFTLLGSVLVEDSGKVFSFEASPKTHGILKKNIQQQKNVSVHNLAVSDKNSNSLKFYEFPNLYSEYNTLHIEQFEEENWFSDYQPVEIEIDSIVLDDFILNENINPKLIKVDVEGAEYSVVKGLNKFLSDNSPMLVLEYLSEERGNEEHKNAEEELRSYGYSAFLIDTNGGLKKVKEISKYLADFDLESDNIVFVKT